MRAIEKETAATHIKTLPAETRAHIRHVIFNGLQAIAGHAEEGRAAEASTEVQRLANEITAMGI